MEERWERVTTVEYSAVYAISILLHFIIISFELAKLITMIFRSCDLFAIYFVFFSVSQDEMQIRQWTRIHLKNSLSVFLNHMFLSIFSLTASDTHVMCINVSWVIVIVHYMISFFWIIFISLLHVERRYTTKIVVDSKEMEEYNSNTLRG